ncbi:MAG: helix-turn-helix domain-containing protein [Dysgonomonas sp.]
MKHILLVILGCVILTFPALAQKEALHKKDSLRRVIAVSKGEDKLKAYQILTNIYFYETYGEPLKRDTLFALYKEMKKEAEQQGEYKYSGFTLSNILLVYESNKMFDEAIKLAPEHLKYYAEHNLWNYYYDTHRLLVKIYRHKGEYEKGLSEAKKVYDEAKVRGHKYGLAIALYAMSNTYGSMRRFEDEEKCMRQSIETLKELNIWTKVTSGYFYLCQSLMMQKRYDDAKKELGEYEKAIHRAEEYLFTKDDASWSSLFTIAADIYFESGDYDKAEFYCKKLESGNTKNFRTQVAIANIRASIFEARKEYKKALEQIELRMKLEADKPSSLWPLRMQKARVISRMGQIDEAYDLYIGALNGKDSIYNIELNAQLDELRTQYEVDKITSEKEKARNYMYFALAGCFLLALLLGLRIYYSRQVAKKNRALANQIKELKVQQEHLEEELLNKTSFDIEEEDSEDDFCPEKRKDMLCITIRDAILKEKAYRDPLITRDNLIERIGTNKELFIDAFQYCFGMSFPEYINHLRLKDAVTLLEQSDLSIEDVSDKVGFGTVRTFQRQFQIKYNMSPKDYRKATMQ